MNDNQNPTPSKKLSSQDLVDQALARPPADDEVSASNEVAETLGFLQNVIERNANELMKVKEELRLKRESLKSVFDSDAQLSEANSEVEILNAKLKERKTQIVNSPQSVSLKNQVGELNQQKKEIEETLSNHLLSYYAMTNSTSFDTSDGDQWEFNIKAAVKSRKTENEN
jgi:hypothetical protein